MPAPSPARALLALLTVGVLPHLQGAAPRALPPGKLPADHRLAPPKDLDGYFPFQVPASREAWQRRAEQVRQRIQVSQGLWPMPTRSPLNPVIHGRIERDGYTIDKVHFESAPGFHVTGNLYRPTKTSGPAPGVLFAHGHWKDARLSRTGDDELRREIASGQERFEAGGRSKFQAMCVQLARMGCVVWQWDMLGDSDALQLTRDLVHGFARQRPEMNTATDWGLFSPAAETHLQSVMGLQTWNAVRSLDFLLSLPGVDPERIAMTGASGGGTQTMLLSAIDPRISLSFPAVMVSTAMQGGCTCENASLLRVGTGNVEFAGLFAPKPLGMTTADDWTREMATKGFPELKRLYTLLGAADNVMLHRGEHFPHNYNAVSRSAFFTFLNRHFGLGFPEPVIERDYDPLPASALTVWDAQHPAPESGNPEFERKLLRLWHEDSEQQLARLAETDPAAHRETLRIGWNVVLDGDLSDAGSAAWEMTGKEDRGTWIQMVGLLRNTTYGEEIPAVFCHPKAWNGETVVWLSEAGKAGLFGTDDTPVPAVRALLERGATVMGIDLLHQGEFLKDGRPLDQTPRVRNPREAAAYTFGYNPSVFVHRVHDVLTAARFLRDHERRSKRISLVALDGTAPIAAAARAQAGDTFARTALHTGDFRFGNVLDLRSPDFVPGGAKYGDLPGLLSLGTGAVREFEREPAAALLAGWLGQ